VGSPTDHILPRHIAVVMDGNGRWARARRLPRPAGHRQGVEATRRVVRACVQRGVQVLTLFAFSSENWQRPKAEVSKLMELFFSTLRREARDLASHGVRLRFIGDRGAFSEKLQRQIAVAEEVTAGRCDLLLNIAANYGGRWDITQAVRTLVSEVACARFDPAQITPAAIAARLVTADAPEPDLFIRTGGERRISNFLLWQLAYTELYFTDVLWPDFDESALDAALGYYAGRQRRYGKTGEQIRGSRAAPGG
jgi:undecaprenyl diphosphate synthase